MSAAATQPGWGSYMASLIIGASVFVHEKIKDKKEAKKEAKRKAYEKRYEELETEHKKTQHQPNRQVEKDQTGSSEASKTTMAEGVRTSQDSRRSEDGPSQWVNGVSSEKGR
ncbi:hypothetical protein PMZ80_003003 [Knufia obscura]|uniref:Uncharacterized protein n=2 Tax=Knufia TaxID=430999 RepID=A0AAN8ECL6_9EURO|nr:hypothetical protein PMZ80_003003 [Knufia obscura]KAK5952409.1 hypothetical protein OHC33_006452 [Knufia fluminis]